jgi:hypothetical protein
VKLPGLPMEWWSIHGIKVIGDIIGHNLMVDESFVSLCVRKVAILLVEVDMCS